VLAHDRIVFLQLKLVCVILGVLLRDVEKARVRGADQLDIVFCLCHCLNPNFYFGTRRKTCPPNRKGRKGRNVLKTPPFVKFNREKEYFR